MTLEMACSSNSRVLLAKSWDIWDVQDTELTAFQLVSQTSWKTVTFSGCWILEVQETRPKKHLYKKATAGRQCEKISFDEGILDSSFDLPLHG